MSEHPKYPQDTIKEAICEFRFGATHDGVWTAKTPGELFKALGPDRFPGIEPITEIGFKLELNEGQPRPAIHQLPTRYKFSNQDETKLIQASPKSFAYNCVGKYPGWEAMESEILSSWKTVSPYIAPHGFERISLRYINQIPAQVKDKLSDWISPSELIPAGIIKTQYEIKYRFENWLSDRDWIIVNILRQRTAETVAPIFFDIDRLRKCTGLPTNEELKSIIGELHNDIWDAFEGAGSKKLQAYLKGLAEAE